MKKIRLGDLVNTSSGATPLSSNKEYYENGDIPWINSGEVGQYKINFAEKFITKEGFEKSNTKIFPKDTILVAMYGATAGKTSILNINACTNQAVCAILPSENVNNIFLKYKLDSIYDYLVQISSGSARDNLSQKVIQDLEINLPLLETQQKIAKILSDIDDKIEVLHQINDNLAELAKTIYDYWFVQFDFPDENGKPYKSSGGKMVYNKVLKREIPEGWEVKKLGEILTIASGFPFDSNDYNEYGNYQIITIKNVQENYLSLSKADRISFIPSKMKSFCFLEIGDILISLTGNVGRLCFVNKQNLLLNQRVGKFLCDEKYKNYIYCLFNSNETKVRLEKIATGSSQKNLSPIDAVDSFSFIPKENILKKFNKKTNPIYKKNIENLQQIERLQSLRDWLLPMLMNGQISVE